MYIKKMKERIVIEYSPKQQLNRVEMICRGCDKQPLIFYQHLYYSGTPYCGQGTSPGPQGVHNYTVEPLYNCGHLGDLVKCLVHSEAPLLWTPWGPGEVPCIQWSPSIVDTLGTWCILYLQHTCSKVSLIQRCPYFRSVH